MIRLIAGRLFCETKDTFNMVESLKNENYYDGEIVSYKNKDWIVDNHETTDAYVRIIDLNGLSIIESDNELSLPGFIKVQRGCCFRYMREENWR